MSSRRLSGGSVQSSPVRMLRQSAISNGLTIGTPAGTTVSGRDGCWLARVEVLVLRTLFLDATRIEYKIYSILYCVICVLILT
jgi:hypothetical protein